MLQFACKQTLGVMNSHRDICRYGYTHWEERFLCRRRRNGMTGGFDMELGGTAQKIYSRQSLFANAAHNGGFCLRFVCVNDGNDLL